jgi:hypothetical protein
MEIITCAPTPVKLPGGRLVQVPTQRWALPPWKGAPDPPELKLAWARKPKFAVEGSRSCAELAIVAPWRGEGWDGVWVSAFGGQLRTRWFPAPPAASLAGAGAPAWAVTIFDRLRAANAGRLGGFFDVFAWRDPGEVRFAEAKVATDRIQPTQTRFLELALQFHPLESFSIIEIP